MLKTCPSYNMWTDGAPLACGDPPADQALQPSAGIGEDSAVCQADRTVLAISLRQEEDPKPHLTGQYSPQGLLTAAFLLGKTFNVLCGVGAHGQEANQRCSLSRLCPHGIQVEDHTLRKLQHKHTSIT